MGIDLRSVRGRTVGKRELLLGAGALCAVLFLIFSPELMTAGKDAATDSKTAGTSSGKDPEHSSRGGEGGSFDAEADESAGPMARLLSRVKSGEFEASSGATVERGNGGELEQPRAPEVEEAPAPRPATWEMLHNEDYGKVLQSVTTRSLQLFGSLDRSFVRARQGILNFANGTRLLVSGAEDLMPAADALAYLENLRLQATRALEEDGVPAAAYETWRAIAIDAARATDDLKRGVRQSVRFDVQPQNAVAIQHAGGGGSVRERPEKKSRQKGKKGRKVSKNGRKKGKAPGTGIAKKAPGLRGMFEKHVASGKPAAPSLNVVLLDARHRTGTRDISFSGLIKGEAVDRVEVYRNGVYLADAIIADPIDGAFPFHFHADDGTGEFALRVVNRRGEFLERRYQFLENVG